MSRDKKAAFFMVAAPPVARLRGRFFHGVCPLAAPGGGIPFCRCLDVPCPFFYSFFVVVPVFFITFAADRIILFIFYFVCCRSPGRETTGAVFSCPFTPFPAARPRRPWPLLPIRETYREAYLEIIYHLIILSYLRYYRKIVIIYLDIDKSQLIDFMIVKLLFQYTSGKCWYAFGKYRRTLGKYRYTLGKCRCQFWEVLIRFWELSIRFWEVCRPH